MMMMDMWLAAMVMKMKAPSDLPWSHNIAIFPFGVLMPKGEN
jgi:hypothetical protein